MVPAGARVLPNAHGTAPGLAIEVRPKPVPPGGGPAWLILLPGPPRELRPMFSESVVPLLLQELPPAEKLVCRTLKTTGLGESLVEEKIAAPLQELVAGGLELGYCARIGEVEVRLAARGRRGRDSSVEAEAIVRQLLGRLIFAVGDESIEATVGADAAERGKTVAVAESCTGGMIAHRLTNVPGASAVLKCGLVTYSNEAKRDLLGVSRAALERTRRGQRNRRAPNGGRARGKSAAPITPSRSRASPGQAAAARPNQSGPFSSRWRTRKGRL